MAGYTRYDTSNNIATGNVINAADLDGEFDALVAAFHASTGHVHDGTAANGAPITKLGPAQEYVGNGTSFSPKTTAVYDLGTSSLRWNNLQVVNLNASNTAIEDGIIVSGRSGGTSSYRVSIVPTTLTASRTVTLPDSTGAVVIDSVNNIFKNASGQTFLASSTTTQDGIVINGRAGGTSSYRATFVPTTLTASRTLTIPDVSGTLLTTGTTVTVSQGGTGRSTLTANYVILGNGTSNVQLVAPGTSGNVLTSDGTTWSSSFPAVSLVGNNEFTGANIFYNATGQTFTNTSASDGIIIKGRAGGTYSYRVTVLPTTLTASRTITLPDADINFTTGLSAANGGTGRATLTANNVILGNGTSAVNFVAPGTAGNVLTSNGTTWTSSSNPLQATTDSTSPYGTFLGNGAGASNTSTGTDNTFIGFNAGTGNTTGDDNTAVGYRALGDNVGGGYNVAIGHEAGYLSNGYRNVAMGVSAMRSAAGSTADLNVAIGYNSLYSQATGAAGNTVIGAYAGENLTTGTYNVFIGYNTRGSSATIPSSQIVIGNSVTGAADSNVTIGSSAGKIYNAYTVNATWTQTSDGTMKNIVGPDTLGLSFIKRLNPIKYTWKPRNELPQDHPYYNEVNPVDTTTVIHGFVAQEVKAALDAEGCDTFNGWDQGSDGIQAISREMFISPLVKAVQELAAQVEALQAEIAILKAQP